VPCETAELTARGGLVTVNGAVVGSVLRERQGQHREDEARGWVIVPRSDLSSYRYWCRAPES
jgi:hypothetical protein